MTEVGEQEEQSDEDDDHDDKEECVMREWVSQPNGIFKKSNESNKSIRDYANAEIPHSIEGRSPRTSYY